MSRTSLKQRPEKSGVSGQPKATYDSRKRPRRKKTTTPAKPPFGVIQRVNYVLLPVFCALTGYTLKAVRRKIEEGVWLEGVQYYRAMDGHIFMDLAGFEQWVAQGKLVA